MPEVTESAWLESAWLLGPVVVPLATALLMFVLGGRLRILLVSTTVAMLGLTATVITWRVWQHGPQTYPLGNWEAPLGIVLRADGLSCLMLLMSALVGGFVSFYALVYLAPSDAGAATIESNSGGPPDRQSVEMFWPLWLLLWTALHALFLSGDVFNLYVTLELLTLAAIGLAVLDGQRAAMEAALRYLLVALAGSLLYLAGVALLYAAHGTLDIALLGQRVTVDDSSRAAVVLVFSGLMLKTALFPFHFWLPPAHGSAPAPVSALLSGLVVKGSFYILLRLWFDLFPSEVTGPLAMFPTVLGTLAILWGSLQALFAVRLKMLVAYSTVAQIGYLFLVFGLVRPESADGFAAWSGCVLLAFSHACAKGSLFLAAGTIYRAAGHDRISDLPAAARALPLTFFGIGIASVALMGLPPTGAFVAKWMLLRAAFSGGQIWIAVVIVVGGLLAAAYLLRVLSAPFTKLPETESEIALRPVPRLLEQVTFGLATVSLLLGLASSPAIALLRIGSPWSSTVVQSSTIVHEAAP